MISKGNMIMTISIKLNDEEALLINNYSKANNISISDLFRQTVLERIEDEYDLQEYNKAIVYYKTNPVTYSHQEVGKML